MRIALVSPYSWTYPGGVTRHIEALAGELLRRGHDVRVLAPFDPSDRRSARLHRGHAPEEREVPPYLVPLGRTIGIPANGAVSNVAATTLAVGNLRRELETGGYDVVHLHEPVAPLLCWDTLCATDLPIVGTFHTYSENTLTHGIAAFMGSRRRMNRLRVRIAVSDAAAWTAKRFFGGEYRVIPNGVDVPAAPLAFRPPRAAGAPLQLVFVGQAVERKGLPLALRAFEALREHVPAELTLVGATDADVEPILHDARGVRALGKVDDATKVAALRQADVLVAPSLGGESFGMVLTEAFAAGTPVVASDIAGYRDVVHDGVDGVLVPKADATALAEALRDLALDPDRRERMSAAAAEHAQRFAWARVAEEVEAAYEDALAVPVPATVPQRVAARIGVTPADGGPRRPAKRLPSLEPKPAGHSALKHNLRRGAIGLGAGLAAGFAFLALQRIGLERIGESLLAATPVWVLVGLGLMCLSMAIRAVAWHAILGAALGRQAVRFRDAFQGTTIGVLMSATLPARLGEPARAVIVARRVGRPRETLPIVVGTLVSQTLLNILALVVLGSVMFATTSYFDDHHSALWFFAATPIAVILAVLAAPALLRGGAPSRFTRLQTLLRRARAALVSVRAGLVVFRRPRAGELAVTAQLGAWLVQWSSCYALLVAFGLDETAGLGAAAAVLFAVNVTAVLPATPSNLGVFQAACVAVLSGAYGVGSADALGYGIVLQAVEIATAIVMGTPSLLREGLSWRDVRARTLHAAPVVLPPLPAAGAARAEAAEA